MKVLVINCGSSSLKYQLFDMDTEQVQAKGLVERIGIDGSRLVQEIEGKDDYINLTEIPDHDTGVRLVFEALTDAEHGVLKSVDEIAAVGHRGVHGGEKITASCLIDETVMQALRDNIPFSPLHNPANIQGIEACRKVLGDKPMVAVFDTAFHQTMPAENYIYALPYELYEKHGIRRYGFHGTSHHFITNRAAELLDKPVDELNIISCHLGNGSSITAVRNGKSVNTTMGLTPLEGVPMGTRSGSIDPAIVTFLQNTLGMSVDDVDRMMNKESGVLGISGNSSDFRDLEQAAEKGCARSRLALDIFAARVRGMIGQYAVELGRVDAITFTGGVGENGASTRADICKGLEILGVELDPEINAQRKPKEKTISTPNSKIRLMVIPTDEELMIARDTKKIVEGK
ncbi:MAG: acetate kinase [Ndongobacter sp.]|nr:acetate kinase [Ndongobacter sp.]